MLVQFRVGRGEQRGGENFGPKKEVNKATCNLSVLVIKTDRTECRNMMRVGKRSRVRKR